MGIFGLFKKQVKVFDKNFGELTLISAKDKSKSFLSGRGYFNQQNPVIGYVILSDAEGPSEEQYLFYKDIQNIYPALQEKISVLIIDEFKNWKEDFTITDFDKEFFVDGITIPNLNKLPLEWDLTFTTVHDIDHWITIDFIDMEPNNILIDG